MQDVHLAIRCELIDAVHEAKRQATAIASLRENTADFFDSWGIKYTLTLQVVENSSANIALGGTSNPTPNPGDTVATLGVGLGGTAKATRVETDQSFSTVKLYAEEKACSGELTNKFVPNGSDLGFSSWILTRLGLVDSGVIGSLTERESFTYRVQFDIARIGSFSPTWTFVQRELSSVAVPLSGGRSVTHSILITFGPTNAARSKLAEDAAAVHNASIIGTFVEP